MKSNFIKTANALEKKINDNILPLEYIPVAPYVTISPTGNVIYKDDFRNQTRYISISYQFIEKTVNKVYKKYGSDIKSVDDVEEFDDLYAIDYGDGNPPSLVGGNHTVGIQAGVGLDITRARIIDFQKDCNGDMNVVAHIGNVLNKQKVESQGLSNEDIKIEYYKILDSKSEAGEDPSLTDEETEWFLECYPQVSARTLGQWKSHHKSSGGRRNPKKEWDRDSLNETYRYTTTLTSKYKDYIVLKPRTLDAFDRTALEEMVKGMVNDPNKTKVLVMLYCSTITQVDLWLEGNAEQEVKDYYQKVSERFGITLEYEMLAWE